ncbi:CIC11C00000003785 [Sungouiella intermedia]|uniref:CIC11C00000003785 n=1 Tax=Sungouiella intermedia TaxID=45354 RepID=A0A1L0C0C3_9ASCO|nr:CIC11C00000003785 [[Candida] intermedia]
MKILMTLHQWKRPRNIRKRFLRRLKLSEKKQLTQNITTEPAGRIRRSLEKLVYVPNIDSASQPPTYDECVEYAPPLHPPPATEKTVPDTSVGEQMARANERGRPRELLYKLQLNDIMLRRPRRPSPEARKPIKPADIDYTNYRELIYWQSRATAWVLGFEAIRWATLVWLMFTCLMLAIA